jgi:hypothetical protein
MKMVERSAGAGGVEASAAAPAAVAPEAEAAATATLALPPLGASAAKALASKRLRRPPAARAPLAQRPCTTTVLPGLMRSSWAGSSTCTCTRSPVCVCKANILRGGRAKGLPVPRTPQLAGCAELTPQQPTSGPVGLRSPWPANSPSLQQQPAKESV